MKLFKAILIGIGLVIAVWLGFSLLGLIYSGLWYLFWIGVAVIGGYAGYKYLASGEKENKQLAENEPAVIDMKAADKALEEYKRKYLPK